MPAAIRLRRGVLLSSVAAVLLALLPVVPASAQGHVIDVIRNCGADAYTSKPQPWER